MGQAKVDASAGPETGPFFLDTAAILEAPNLTPGTCRTTPEVAAEVRPGGATARRLDQMMAAGMVVVVASNESYARVRHVARLAGNDARLSGADVSILALALDANGRGVLLSDDYTVLDLALRLGVAAKPITKAGIAAPKDWSARCSGCGRKYDASAAGKPCSVCGHDVRLKPVQRRSRASTK